MIVMMGYTNDLELYHNYENIIPDETYLHFDKLKSMYLQTTGVIRSVYGEIMADTV